VDIGHLPPLLNLDVKRRCNGRLHNREAPQPSFIVR